MATPILATKLYAPPLRPKMVLRPRLIERLNEGLDRKLTLISAPAGFGKTTLVSEWVASFGEQHEPKSRELKVRAAAWLSLDEEDNDLARFLAYLIAALQTIGAQQSSAGKIGIGVLGALQSPQPPPTEVLLTSLLNDIALFPDQFILVLDDYHTIDAKAVNQALAFLVEHLPHQMHLVLATREDPPLPLARLRAQGQLSELRAVDLRFAPTETIEFLNRVMNLDLSKEDIAALETRTEGWIAGLQLAALALQGSALAGQGTSGQRDANSSDFIKSFTGSHHFVLDYLLEEVLQRQPKNIQTFLLRTSILDRLCGPLCDAVIRDDAGGQATAGQETAGQETLEYLERANLFIVPLDSERRWYRYHHLFADLLKQRLLQQTQLQQNTGSSLGDEGKGIAALHIRASQWYEDNGLDIEAFHHAVLAKDIERAARLVEGKGLPGKHSMPLQFRGAVGPVLQWLGSLPTAELDARPSLWVMYASALSMTGQMTGVEQKLQAAEAALQGAELDEKTRNLIGHIAAIRALLAAVQNQVEAIIVQSQRALEYLSPDNLAVRTATIWKLGIAYQLQGNRAAASQAYSEAISISQASGNLIINLSATTGLGNIQETENQLYQAAETYQRVLEHAGNPPLPPVCDARLGLARIFYEWNDLKAAEQHGQQGIQLAQQVGNNDRVVASQVFLARLKLAHGDETGASVMLAEANQYARQHGFVQRLPEVAAVQVLTLLRQDRLEEAAHLAESYELPLSQARVHLARGEASMALGVLVPFYRHVESKGWQNERLRAIVLQAIAFNANGEKNRAVQVLGDALTLAEPGGFIRIFLDEGQPIAELLSEAATLGILPDYIHTLLAAFEVKEQKREAKSVPVRAQPHIKAEAHSLVEPLSQRELEVLRLIAQGLSNQQISKQLFLALNTVKGHNRVIFEKLQVQNRTEAVARARELGLL